MAKWKIVLSALLVVGILGLLFITPAGQTLTNLAGVDLKDGGKLLSGLTTFLNPAPAGEYFTFILTSEPNIMNDRSFDIENGTLIVSGYFVTDVFVGDTVYDVSSAKGGVLINNFKGSVGFGSHGIVSVSGKSTGVSINGGAAVRPSGKDFPVKLEINPTEYFIAPIFQNSIKLAGVSGKIERTSSKSGSQELKGEDVEIISFIGNSRLSGDLSISGAAKIIKGNSFMWKG